MKGLIPLDMNGQKITKVPNPVNNDDAVNLITLKNFPTAFGGFFKYKKGITQGSDHQYEVVNSQNKPLTIEGRVFVYKVIIFNYPKNPKVNGLLTLIGNNNRPIKTETVEFDNF